MWHAVSQEPSFDSAICLRIGTLHGQLSCADAIELWASSADFRGFYTALLGATELDAYFWELPPVTLGTLGQPFEFVLIASPGLARIRPDPAAFVEHFDADPANPVVAFPNLGRDALLVVPSPQGAAAAYADIASFSRQAKPEQQHALWRTVAQMMRVRLGDQETWLSTAGLGVPWLHLRLDSRPKYYRHAPYRNPKHAAAG